MASKVGIQSSVQAARWVKLWGRSRLDSEVDKGSWTDTPRVVEVDLRINQMDDFTLLNDSQHDHLEENAGRDVESPDIDQGFIGRKSAEVTTMGELQRPDQNVVRIDRDHEQRYGVDRRPNAIVEDTVGKSENPG
jgi:hypothetical protein